jgi:hypothetical protein
VQQCSEKNIQIFDKHHAFWFFWYSFTSGYGLSGAKPANNGHSFLLLLLNGWCYWPLGDAREYLVWKAKN